MSLLSSVTFLFGNRGRRKSGDAAGADMIPLADAAARVLAEMRKRDYVLAAVSTLNRSEAEAQEWVAENMVQNVPVFEKDDSGWHQAAKGPIAGRALYAPPSSIAAYLKWAKNTY